MWRGKDIFEGGCGTCVRLYALIIKSKASCFAINYVSLVLLHSFLDRLLYISLDTV